jgi:4-amino-4-deoxy-L-arabinose transferase-like glycosyltransferase
MRAISPMTASRIARLRIRGLSALGLSGWAIGAAVLATGFLVLVSGGYGFHRDELYFIVAGRHPDFGYADQPPLTPLLSAVMTGVLGTTTFAIRLLPALAIGVVVLLTAAMAREMGGDRRSQTVAAVVVGTSGFLGAGHLDHTTTYDLLIWATVAFLLVRVLSGGDPRLWLLVGVVAGVGLENKTTVLFLGAVFVAGVLLDRRWDIVRSPWAWAGIAIAGLIWLPNLAWQVAHDLPQLTMASGIAADTAENRAMLLPTQILLGGSFLFPIVVAGLWRLLRVREARPWRPLALAYLLLLVLLYATAGKGYYAVGLLPPLMAAGAVAAAGWLGRGGRWRAVPIAVAALPSAAFVAVVMLPILPPQALADSVVPDLYGESAEQLGWPELVATVERATDQLAPDERARAIILTANYGEAGALELLGHDLPPVYSGHNSYADWGPPPVDRDVVLLVGHWTSSYWAPFFGRCEAAGRIDNGLGLDNEEQGATVSICRDLRRSWTESWPSIRHLD